MSKEQMACKQEIVFADLTALSKDEQREKLDGLRSMVNARSREYNYPQKWRDYHYTYINSDKVVNPITMFAEYLNREEIKTSDLVIMGRDYNSYFILASISLHTIQQWSKQS